MRHLKPFVTIAASAVFLAPAAAAAPTGTAPDCRFPETKPYGQYGRITLFTARTGDAGRRALYGCLTDVGRARKLTSFAARSARTRPVVFGVGDWIGVSVPSAGEARAQNLRTGRIHSAAAGAVGVLVVNFDGTLAWIADRGSRREVRTKAVGDSRSRLLGSGSSIDRGFLGLENDQGCAITWRLGGEQRSAAIACSRP